MVVVFCLSYLNIPFTDYLASRKKDYVIFTPDEIIYNYLLTYHEKDHIVLYNNLDLKRLNNPSAFLALRRKNIELIREINGADIYFFCTSFCHTTLWMVKRLTKFNNVFYHPAVKLDQDIRIARVDLVSTLKRALLFVLFGIRMATYITRSGIRLIPASNFFKRNSIHKICLELPVNSALSSSRKNHEGEVLYLSGDIIGKVSSAYIEEFNYLNNEVIEILNNYRTMNKPHPRLSDMTVGESRLPYINSQIPASTLLDGFKVVIGYSSAVLFEASNRGLMTISLLKYYKFIDNNEISDSIEYLNSNCTNTIKIHYPEDINELTNLLRKYVE